MTTTLNPETSYAMQTKTVRTVDAYGDLVQSQIYDYGYRTDCGCGWRGGEHPENRLVCQRT